MKNRQHIIYSKLSQLLREKKMPRKAVERKPVHFFFRTHGIKDKYLPKRLLANTATIIHEVSEGSTQPVTAEHLRRNIRLWKAVAGERKPKNYSFDQASLLLEALQRPRKPIQVLPGELATLEEKQQLKRLFSLREAKWASACKTSSLEGIKEYFKTATLLTAFREQIIIRTIKNAPKPLVARFGSGHSRLSRKLQKEGIASSREKKPGVNYYAESIMAKLLAGGEPSNLEYKLGFISLLFMAKMPEVKNETEGNFQSLINAVLLIRIKKMIESGELPETELDKIVQTADLAQVFRLNGLPTQSSQWQLKQFLARHSSFWKRQQAIRRMKRVKSPA
jgi:hypothetical protein